VLRTREGPVVVLTLNRPEQHNAWNSELESAYHDELLRADDDPGIRAIVVTGAGRSFCVGAVAASLEHPDVTEGIASYLERRAPSFQPLPPRSDTDEL
jgi:enoyl-CoA hydratase/carnithine racemase